jgi:DNA-binding GntR family transcriptional regulator
MVTVMLPPDRSETPIRTTGLSEEIAFRLRAEIFDGKLAPGSRLQHEELATRFGVSRTPIREALRQLQALNLVVVSPHRGATVRVPSRVELAEVYELRADIEGFACELACERASEADLAELQRAQAFLTEAIGESGELTEAELDAAVTTWNTAFHRCIHRAAGNRRMTETIESLQHFFPLDSVWRAIAHNRRALVNMNVDEHEAIAAALRSRSSRTARQAMRDHVQGAGRILLGHLDGQRFWG